MADRLRIAERLRRAREARKFETAAAAAQHHGWKESTYTSHENGTRGLRVAVAREYAKAFRIPLDELVGDAVGAVLADQTPVVGEAAWGVWREMALNSEGLSTATFVPVQQQNDKIRCAVRMADTSADKSIPQGDFAIYQELEEDEIPDLPVGTLLVLKRLRSDIYETTVRRVTAHGAGSLTLAFHSNDPRFAGSVQVPYSGNSTWSIVGQVVGRYGEL